MSLIPSPENYSGRGTDGWMDRDVIEVMDTLQRDRERCRDGSVDMEMLKEAAADAAEWRISVDDDDRGTMEYILEDDDGRFWFIMISR